MLHFLYEKDLIILSSEEMKIILGFIFIHCILHSKSCPNGDWIITEDKGVQNQYFEFNIFASPTEESDFSDAYCLYEICMQLKNAKIYKRIHFMEPFPNASSLEEISVFDTDESFGYEKKTLKAYNGKFLGEISVLRCQTHKNKTYWLASGNAPSRVFILQEVDNGQAVSFVAKGDRIPKINKDLPRGESLDNYFWSTYKKTALKRIIGVKTYGTLKEIPHKFPDPTLKQLTLNNFARMAPRFRELYKKWAGENASPSNRYVQSALFRLCCLVHAARQSTHPEKEQFTMNYADSNPITTNHPLILTLNSEGATETTISVVGCAINRKKEADVDFYIHADQLRDRLDAVFVLEQKEVNGKKFLIVAERVYDIPLQSKYAIYFIWRRFLTYLQDDSTSAIITFRNVSSS